MTIDANTRIGVIGAGAGGLSAAYFLKKRGYRNVTVLEKLGRVGGLCSSITYGGRSFDLGANYVTLGFTEILAMAEEVGAELFTEGGLQVYDAAAGEYSSLLAAVTSGSSIFKLGVGALRYFWKRLLLDGVLSRPGYKGIAARPDLCVPFGTWLDQNGMSDLRTLFKIPITLMGYGDIDEMPAPYALTYMSLPTFFNLAVAGTGLPRSWPKRFTQGFQRFWERVAWDLDVRLGANIQEIVRQDGKATVRFTVEKQVVDGIQTREQTMEFDRLIVATPLTIDVMSALFKDLTEEEAAIFGKIVRNPYYLVSYESKGLEKVTAVAYVLPQPALGTPYVVTRQFADNDLVSFYSRADDGGAVTDDEVLAGIEALVEKMGGRLSADPYTFDKWPYFPHVTADDFKDGFYDKIEALQGVKGTYYTGGVLSFELTEAITRYSKHLVATHFPRVSG